MERGRPIFSYHTQRLQYLLEKLDGENLNASKESFAVANGSNGSLCQSIIVLEDTESSSVSESRGCRLVWSRLVDLGSIDPGSNPGSPTTFWVQNHS